MWVELTRDIAELLMVILSVSLFPERVFWGISLPIAAFLVPGDPHQHFSDQLHIDTHESKM